MWWAPRSTVTSCPAGLPRRCGVQHSCHGQTRHASLAQQFRWICWLERAQLAIMTTMTTATATATATTTLTNSSPRRRTPSNSTNSKNNTTASHLRTPLGTGGAQHNHPNFSLNPTREPAQLHDAVTPPGVDAASSLSHRDPSHAIVQSRDPPAGESHDISLPGPRKHSSSLTFSDGPRPLIKVDSLGGRPRTSPSGPSPSQSPSTSFTPTTSITDSIPPTNTSSCEPRSPLTKNKRAPASFSSHGIETSTGPPPALSTQRSYTTVGPSFAQHHSTQSSPAESKLEDQSPKTKNMDRNGFHRYGEDLLEDDRDRTLRALEGSSEDKGSHGYTGDSADRSGLEQTQNGTEDVFLNIARTNSGGQSDSVEATSRSERRRSRIGQATQRLSGSFSSPFTRSSPFASDPRTQPLTDERRHQQHSRRISQGTSPTVTYSPLTRNRSSAASAHPLDNVGRSSYFGRPSRASFSSASRNDGPPAVPTRAGAYEERSPYTPESNAVPGRSPGYRQSKLSYSAPHKYGRSPSIDHSASALHNEYLPQTPNVEGSESTVSTTPASTMWDELDQLKSRIHNLESTGKDPSSSGAGISNASGDRPHTATTTVTSISSSPRNHGKSISPGMSGAGAPAVPNSHPLLQAALAKSKAVLDPDVYRALEATVFDAVAMASMTGSSTGVGNMSGTASVLGSGNSSDRQLRRKADSVCRGLTELCIALADGKPEGASPTTRAQRRISRDTSNMYGQNDGASDVTALTQARQDGQDTDPLTLARSNSRALSRVEARRSSQLGLHSGNSPRTPSEIPTPTTSNFANRPNRRTSALLRNLRAENNLDDTSSDTGYRAPSRAATEIGQTRNSPREYTSQHPLPSSRGPPSSGQASALPLRKHYATASVSGAVVSTPTAQVASSRRYLDRVSPASTYDRDSASVVGDDTPTSQHPLSGLARATSAGRKAFGSRFQRG